MEKDIEYKKSLQIIETQNIDRSSEKYKNAKSIFLNYYPKRQTSQNSFLNLKHNLDLPIFLEDPLRKLLESFSNMDIAISEETTFENLKNIFRSASLVFTEEMKKDIKKAFIKFKNENKEYKFYIDELLKIADTEKLKKSIEKTKNDIIEYLEKNVKIQINEIKIRFEKSIEDSNNKEYKENLEQINFFLDKLNSEVSNFDELLKFLETLIKRYKITSYIYKFLEKKLTYFFYKQTNLEEYKNILDEEPLNIFKYIFDLKMFSLYKNEKILSDFAKKMNIALDEVEIPLSIAKKLMQSTSNYNKLLSDIRNYNYQNYNKSLYSSWINRLQKEVSLLNYNTDNDKKKSTEKYPSITGIKNIGNSCYFNSALQMLIASQIFDYETFIYLYNESKKKNKSNKFLNIFLEIALNILKSPEYYRDTDKLKTFKTLARSDSNYKGYNQEDAGEILTSFLEKLRNLRENEFFNHILDFTNPITNIEDDYIKKTSLSEFTTQNNSNTFVLKNYFMYKESLKCLKCGYETLIFKEMDFKIPIIHNFSNNKSDINYKLDNIRQALHFSENPKLVTGAQRVFSCNCHNQKSELFEIERKPIYYPDNIFINLDRAQTSDDNKNEFLVKYKLKEKFGNEDYELQGVLIHKGFESNYGHYYSYLKHPIYQYWYKADDHIISSISIEEVLNNPDAIVLYYTKKSKTFIKSKFLKADSFLKKLKKKSPKNYKIILLNKKKELNGKDMKLRNKNDYKLENILIEIVMENWMYLKLEIEKKDFSKENFLNIIDNEIDELDNPKSKKVVKNKLKENLLEKSALIFEIAGNKETFLKYLDWKINESEENKELLLKSLKNENESFNELDDSFDDFYGLYMKLKKLKNLNYTKTEKQFAKSLKKNLNNGEIKFNELQKIYSNKI